MIFPEEFVDLLVRPLFAHVTTIRPDGAIQTNPMWYSWDGSSVRLTTTRDRQKFGNVSADPRISLSIHDPERPYRYLELRGTVSDIEPDPDGKFFDELASRYSMHFDELPDRPRRVVIAVSPQSASWQ
jgi:PPOX class probable F420-dependent enzyme